MPTSRSAHGLLPTWKKGKDPKKPSMRHIRIPPQTRGAISASLEGSHRGPRLRPARGQIISASLEGSGPTLEQATHLRLARGHPSA